MSVVAVDAPYASRIAVRQYRSFISRIRRYSRARRDSQRTYGRRVYHLISANAHYDPAPGADGPLYSTHSSTAQ